MAVGLWLTPDFSEVTAGHARPPRVDHSKVNFGKLRDILQSTFKYGPPVQILVPNDTIDQVTIQLREISQNPESMRCADFGQKMLSCASNAVNGQIDVQSAWLPLHAQAVKNRNFAPPPTMLPFVVVADDYEDAQIWLNSCRPVLGLPALGDQNAMDNEEAQHQGKISQDLRKKLTSLFGCTYQEFALLDRLAMDPAPCLSY